MTSTDSRPTILLVGGAGAFGSRVAKLLARDEGCNVILAGRSRDALVSTAAALAHLTGRRPSVAILDSERVTGDDLSQLDARIVINASGPFQSGTYALAQAAISARCHYVDLADARAFVCGIEALDAAAREAGVLVVSGASSVPGLSSAVVAQHRDSFAALEDIDIAISPGNAFDPGVATVASVLGGVGQPFRTLCGGQWTTVSGWQGLRRVDFGDAGQRWLGYVDVPDLELLPTLYPEVRTVRFQAGLEVSAFHLGLWAASWLVRSGLVRSLAPMAPLLLAIKRKLHRLGSDRGGMRVVLSGTDRSGARKEIAWLLVARNNDGPYVPALASVALAKRLASGAETRRGAMACVGLLSLADILAEADGLDITASTKEKALPL